LLAEYFIDRYGKKAGKSFKDISKGTLELFQEYDWPGNIRELQNVYRTRRGALRWAGVFD
jgi:formate hydrogenlyase transcriptional activator